MGKFTVIPQDTFSEIQTEAGVILRRFNPANPVAPADEDIVCATTGGITASCVPTFSDMGEDVDNCPVNMKELKHLDSWEAKLAFTSIGTSPKSIRLSLGCADIDSNDETHIIPRADLKQTDYTDLWWVGDRADGGLVACKLKNALSTSGFSLKTTKKGKGNVSVELTGHVSLHAQKEVPMEFYSMNPDDNELYVYINKTRTTIEEGNTETLTVNATSGATVAWSSSDTSIATVDGGVVEAVDEGVCVIMAKATKSGESVIATCTVTVIAGE